MARKRTAGRPAQGLLTRERILDAAMEIVDAEGLAALTMRRLAAALRVDPMAIYHHLPGREELLAALAHRVFEPYAAVRWRGRSWKALARQIARAYRETVRRHPNLVVHVVQSPGSGGEASLPAFELLFRALESAGMSPRNINTAVDTLGDFLNGWLVAEVAPRARPEVASLASYPTVRRVLNAAPPPDDDGRFERCLNVVIAGIEAALL